MHGSNFKPTSFWISVVWLCESLMGFPLWLLSQRLLSKVIYISISRKHTHRYILLILFHPEEQKKNKEQRRLQFADSAVVHWQCSTKTAQAKDLQNQFMRMKSSKEKSMVSWCMVYMVYERSIQIQIFWDQLLWIFVESRTNRIRYL